MSDTLPAEPVPAAGGWAGALQQSRTLCESNEFGRAHAELQRALSEIDRLGTQAPFVAEFGGAVLDDLLLTARVAVSLGQYDSVTDAAAHACRLAEQWGRTPQHAEALRLWATAANFTGHFSDAMTMLREAAGLFSAAGDSVNQAKCLNNLGGLLTNLGAHADALAVLFQCHQLVTQYADSSQFLQGPCFVNLGHTYHAMRQPTDAHEYLQLGLEAARGAGDLATEVAALSMLGLVYKDTGQRQQAVATLSQGLDLAVMHGLTRDFIDLSDTLGQVLAESGQHLQALDMHQRSMDAAVKEDDQQGVSNALLGLGRVAAGLGHLQEAVVNLEQALEVAQRHALQAVELAVHAELSSCFERLGNDSRALLHHKEFHRLERALFNEESESKTRNLTARHAAERARIEAETYRQLSELAQQAREEAEQTVQLRTQELQEAQFEIVTRLGFAGEYRDDLTGEHTQRVGQLSYQIGVTLNMPHEETELLKWAARLHDIGKIGITDAVLLKPGRYTPEEHERMKLHTVIGAKMLEGSTSRLLVMAEQIALTHHERWDGTGYPRGLAGTDIPLAGRIVAVADVFDALTSERPYKPAWTQDEALTEIRRVSGSQFDPQVVESLERILSSAAAGPGEQARAQAQRQGTGRGGGVREAGASSAGVPVENQHLQLDALITASWNLRQSDPTEGERLANEAFALAQGLHDLRALGYAYRNMGFFHYAAARYEEALSYLSKGLEFGGHLEDAGLQVDCANFSAAVYNSLTHYEKAIDMLSLTMRISRELGDQKRTANTLHNLGIVAIENRDYDRAEGYLADAVTAYRLLGDVSGEAHTLATCSRLAFERGRFDEAVTLGTTSLELLRQYPSPLLEATASMYLGKAQREKGDFAASVASLTLTLECARPMSHVTMEGWALCELGTTHLAAGHFDDAQQHLQQALEVSRTASQRTLEMQVFQTLAQLHETRGESDEALSYYRLHHNTEREIFTHEAALKTRALTIELEVERAKADTEIFKVRSIELTAANEALQRADAEKNKLLAMLETQSKLLERQVSEDGLTGLYNRRFVEQALARDFRQSKKTGGQLAVAMIDLDHFKQINDRFSHMVGDQVLRQVATLFAELCRPTDVVARYGGEEFLLVFPGATLEQGRRICERICRRVAEYEWHEIHPNLRVTLSVGVAADLTVHNHEKLLSLADAKLYEAKEGGRNRVHS